MSRINKKKKYSSSSTGLAKLLGIWTPGFGVARVGKPFTSKRFKKKKKTMTQNIGFLP